MATKNTWCPNCKSDQSFGEYCVLCGKGLQPKITCECGEKIYGYFKFCPKCGKKVADGNAPTL